MRIETLNETLVQFLRDNITHPDPSHSATDMWIYLDYPRPDATFPRISVTQTDAGSSPVGIDELYADNTQGLLYTFTYDIDVWVKSGNVYTIVADNVKRGGSRLRDYLVDEILKQLMSQKYSYWKVQKNAIDLSIDSIVTVPYMDEYELYRKTITITFTFYRERTA